MYGLTETGYGLAWNDAYHLVSVPSLFAMGAGRFYEGTLRSERPFDYDPHVEWDSQRIVHEAILLKGIDVFRKCGGRKFDSFVDFLGTDFLDYQEIPQ